MTMTQEQMRTLTQRQLDAYNQANLDDFCRCFHPEIKMMQLISGSTVVTGMAEFRKLFARLFSENPKLHCELKARLVGEHAVADEEWITGASSGPRPEYQAIITYGFRDGLIDRIWSAR